jgi:hypothetical protein
MRGLLFQFDGDTTMSAPPTASERLKPPRAVELRLPLRLPHHRNRALRHERDAVSG